MSDLINHPPHYNQGKIEVIDAIEDWGLDFHEANIVKYIARAKHKGDELENLQKALWYLNRLIGKKEAKKPFYQCEHQFVAVNNSDQSAPLRAVRAACIKCGYSHILEAGFSPGSRSEEQAAHCECDDSWVVVSAQDKSPYVNCICARCEKPVTRR
jgi:hypothetical protein